MNSNSSDYDDSKIETIFNSIINIYYNTTIIIDFNNKILYSTYSRIYPVFVDTDSMNVSPNNTISLKISDKTGNKLSVITDEDEKGLYVN